MTAVENPEPATDSTIDQARAIAASGLRVLPIKPGEQHPPMNSWQTAATTEERTIAAWWNGLYRTHGIGLAMGPQPDGRIVFAIDIDQHDPAKDGFEELHDLETEHGELPDTVTSLTGGGGQHRLFRAPHGSIVRNQQNQGNRVAPGIDVRGDGGQIVVSPTVHPKSGRRYEWDAGHAPWECDIATAPAWLLKRVIERPTPTPAPTIATPQGDSIAADVRTWWDWQHELTARGWTFKHAQGGDTYWTRPGKEARDGHSAVLHGNDCIVIFTTDIPASWLPAGTRTHDGSGWSFSPFGFYAAAEHDGDRSAAARELRRQQNLATAAEHSKVPPALTEADTDAEPEPSYDEVLSAMLVDWPAFWAEDHGEAEWIAEPVLAAHRSTALFAPGGTGKSLLSLYISAAVATGGRVFGASSPARSVLYLDYEMTPDDLAERLEQMGYGDEADLSNLHYALLPSLPGLDEPEGGKAVVRLAEMVGAELVVIDTFSRAVHGDENEADTVRAWYRNTGLHLKHDGRAFLRVDHAGKDVSKGQRGSSAKNDDVDVVWQMLAKENSAYTLTAKKRRMGWVPERVDLVLNEQPRMEFALTKEHVWSSGTGALASELDRLDIDVGLSGRKAGEIYRQAGGEARNDAIREAQKYRNHRTMSVYLVDDTTRGQPHQQPSTSHDERVTNPQVNAPQNSGRGPSENDRGAVRGAVDPKNTKPLVDGSGRGAGRGGARSRNVTGAQCAPSIGAHAATVTNDDTESDMNPPSPPTYDTPFT